MREQERHFMILVQLVHLLDKGQAAQESPGLVYAQGLVIRALQPLKGAERIEGIKIFRVLLAIILLQEHIIGDALPFFLNKLFCKGMMHSIGMGKATVTDLGKMPVFGSPAAIADTAKKQGLPPVFFFQRGAGLVQG